MPSPTVGELLQLARAKPTNGEDAVKQLFQWRQDTRKGLALAIFGVAASLLASVLVAVAKDEIKIEPWRAAVIAIGSALSAFAAVLVLWSLRTLYAEYVLSLRVFLMFRRWFP